MADAMLSWPRLLNLLELSFPTCVTLYTDLAATYAYPGEVVPHSFEGGNREEPLLSPLFGRGHNGPSKGDEQRCRECGDYGFTVGGLRAHLHEKHNGAKRFPCEDCEKGFDTLQQYLRHYNFNHSGIFIKCNDCDWHYPSQSYFDKHIDQGSCKARTDRHSCSKVEGCPWYITGVHNPKPAIANHDIQGHPQCEECGLVMHCSHAYDRSEGIVRLHKRKHKAECKGPELLRQGQKFFTKNQIVDLGMPFKSNDEVLAEIEKKLLSPRIRIAAIVGSAVKNAKANRFVDEEEEEAIERGIVPVYEDRVAGSGLRKEFQYPSALEGIDDSPSKVPQKRPGSAVVIDLGSSDHDEEEEKTPKRMTHLSSPVDMSTSSIDTVPLYYDSARHQMSTGTKSRTRREAPASAVPQKRPQSSEIIGLVSSDHDMKEEEEEDRSAVAQTGGPGGGDIALEEKVSKSGKDHYYSFGFGLVKNEMILDLGSRKSLVA